MACEFIFAGASNVHKKELKKEFSDQGLARASNVHKKVKIDLIGDRLEGIA